MHDEDGLKSHCSVFILRIQHLCHEIYKGSKCDQEENHLAMAAGVGSSSSSFGNAAPGQHGKQQHRMRATMKGDGTCTAVMNGATSMQPNQRWWGGEGKVACPPAGA